ncbi:hypothetical protein F7O44_07995 [Phytoactinopolyspora sp. XMNu-373]|uniref:Uncharacterized protein n=1 Tax=Phytoactinopolyspora mesophila TaxID=2650750 RepID=A0A7K3M185_9ACTN|nr:hypothetical protein [Phytoactinopolyspora mesophila]
MADASRQDGARVGWPCGHELRPVAELPDILIKAGSHHGKRARKLYQSKKYEELLDAAISAGIAVEMVAKACVAKLNPALLAGRLLSTDQKTAGAQDTILYLAGHHDLAIDGNYISRISTVNAKVAVAVAKRIDRRKHLPSADTECVIDARDAAIHMGLVDAGLLENAVENMVRFIDGALKMLNKQDDEFWENVDSERVKQLLDHIDARGMAAVTDKIKQSKEHYSYMIRLHGYPTVHLLADTATKFIFHQWSNSKIMSARCPACKNNGWYVVDSMSDAEHDHDEVLISHHYAISHFECPYCTLRLDEDELAHAGLEDDGDELMESEWDEDSERER